MELYLPIAQMSVNPFLIIGMGIGIGIMSGLFGVGGGFLLTPLLFMVGIPPAIAVGTSANQIMASSISAVLAHFRDGNVDVKMGTVLTIGGFLGSIVGVYILNILIAMGNVDAAIKIFYVVFLGGVGAMMLWESVSTYLVYLGYKKASLRKPKNHGFLHGLPFRTRFRRSGLYISILLPAGLGFCIGMLTSLMGVGGGFVMVPAMIYLLGMPTLVVIGTSLFQIIFVTANVTFFQAYANQAIDIVLAVLLIIGGVLGAQVGAQVGKRLRGDQLRILLALIVVGVAIKIFFELVIAPSSFYSLEFML